MLGSPHFDDDLEFLKFYGDNKKLLLGTRFESIAWMTMNEEMYIGTWLPGEPDEAFTYCLKLDTKEDEYGPVGDKCDKGHDGFICEIQAENISLSCPYGWYQYRESCYIKFAETINWFQAVTTCGAFQAYPVIFDGEREKVI